MATVDRSVRRHQTGVFDPASNNPINFYSTAYATQYNHRKKRQPTLGPDELPLTLSGATRGMLPTALDSGQTDFRGMTARGFGYPITSAYESDFKKPYNLTAKEEIKRLGKLKIFARRHKNGEMVNMSGTTRNNDFEPRNFKLEDMSTYSTDFNLQTDENLAAYRQANNVYVHNKADNGFTKNNVSNALVDPTPPDGTIPYATTNGECAKRTAECATSFGGGEKLVGEKESNGFIRDVTQNDALLGRGYAERPQTVNFTQVSREMAQLKRDDPITYQYTLAGRASHDSTYYTSHDNVSAIDAGRGQDILLEARQSRVPLVAPTDYALGDGYTGMYTTQNRRDRKWLSSTLPRPGAFQQHVQHPRTSGYLSNADLPSVRRPYTALQAGDRIGSEAQDRVLSSHVYGGDLMTRQVRGVSADTITRGTKKSPFIRLHMPEPRRLRSRPVHPTVDLLQSTQRVVVKNVGENVFMNAREASKLGATFRPRPHLSDDGAI